MGTAPQLGELARETRCDFEEAVLRKALHSPRQEVDASVPVGFASRRRVSGRSRGGAGGSPGPSGIRWLARAFAVWVAIAVAETLHGVARTLLLAPILGDRPSRQLGVLVGSIMILGIAWLSSGWILATTRAQQLAVGLLWLVLMLAFEVGLGRSVGFSWERILAEYDPARGGLMMLGMGVLLLAPLLAAEGRRAVKRHAGQRAGERRD